MNTTLFKDTISDQTMLHLTEVYFTNWINFTMDFHTHNTPSLELNYITHGTCDYYIGNQMFTLHKKNLLIIDTSVPHKLVLTSPEPCSMLGFTLTLVPILPMYCSSKSLFTYTPSLVRMFEDFRDTMMIHDGHSLFEQMQRVEREARTDQNTYYLHLLLNQTLIDLSRLVCNSNQQVTDYIEQIKSYLIYHYFSIKNMDEIANYMGLNKVYMQRIFKQVNHKTIWCCLTEIRMEKAAYILSNSSMPIGEIDSMIGIHSRHNFYILFKKSYGMSPQEYRKKTREEKSGTFPDFSGTVPDSSRDCSLS